MTNRKSGTESPTWKGTPEERFRQFVGEPDANGCVPWLGGTNWGYGSFGVNRRQHVRAHRYAWELEHGKIPEGRDLHHRCRNRRCVNVDHLELLTPENHRRLHAAKAETTIVSFGRGRIQRRRALAA